MGSVASARRLSGSSETIGAADLSGATSLQRWGDATWSQDCWGEPDAEQQLRGEVLKSICARLHENASLLVFGLGRDSKLWYENAVNKKNTFFLENHEDWLKFQNEDVVKATRLVKYTSEATKYKEELQDEEKLAELFESLPAEIKRPFDLILVDSPIGVEWSWMPSFVGAFA